ncbi:MAG: two-partner secretion domain-containing protein [Schwartzia sp. (in: firmicutes)]
MIAVKKKEYTKLRRRVWLGLTAALLSLGGLTPAGAEPAVGALPTGGQVADGTASISQAGAVMSVVQTTDKAIINWGTFNVGRGATVNFYQPSMAASTLNRVSAAGGLSEIYGKINSVGSVILINPNGILFAGGSEVNAAGIIASTADVANASYKDGTMLFAQNKDQNANIVIHGTLNVAPGGSYLAGMPTEVGERTVLNVAKVREAKGFDIGTHTIKIVADGDIAVGPTGVLKTPMEKLVPKTDGTVGVEAFSIEGASKERESVISLRADQNADDVAQVEEAVERAAGGTYGTPTTYNSTSRGVRGRDGQFKTAKVYLNNNTAIQSQNVGVYYDADIVGEINGTSVADIGVSGSREAVFTAKDATRYAAEAAAYRGKVNQSGILSQTYAMLVNSPYQLQAMQDTPAVAAEKGFTSASHYGNLGGVYALGTAMMMEDTKNWNGGKGFDSLGSDANPFTGGFTGHGGSNGYGVYDLFIRRDDRVGLFAVAQGAHIWSVGVIDANITGKNYVGSVAGLARDGAWLDGVTARKRIEKTDGAASKTNGQNNVTGEMYVGGLVGAMQDSSLRYGTNASQVAATGAQQYVGGLTGAASGMKSGREYTVYGSRNTAYLMNMNDGEAAGALANGYGKVTGGSSVGGLVGAAGHTSAGTAAAAHIDESYNNGTVNGTTDVGGLVGTMETGGKLTNSYNTNERSALTPSSVITADATGAGTSGYGKVTGTTNVGGLVGHLALGTVATAYNAGNISGQTNVGGLVGQMAAGTVEKAYNGDNNTVLKTSTDDATYYGFRSTNGHTYRYDNGNQQWIRDDNTVLTTEAALAEAPEETRLYHNRLAYRDATVTGTTAVGGAIGLMVGGTVNQTYSLGKVTGTTDVGAYGGKQTGGTVTDSFYVTTRQDGSNIPGKTDAWAGVTVKTVYQATNLANDGTTTIADGVTWTGTANQNGDWMLYSNSATPLLKHFMSSIRINRQYEYDGKVHNLTTTDVDNYYGGAFFTNGRGQNVHTDGVAAVAGYQAEEWVVKSGKAKAGEINGISSRYKYQNSDMWSPQHGYYTHEDASVIITQKTLTVTVEGSKTYGENALLGAAETPAAGQYKVRYEGFAAGEGVADGAGVKKKVDVTGLAAVKYNADDQQLDASTYTDANFTNPTLQNVAYGSTADTKNYKFVVKDQLVVKKAKLYYTATGERDYGAGNTVGTLTFKAVTTHANAADSAQDTGALKSWDAAAGTNLTALTGFSPNVAGGVTLVATEAAKNGKNSTSTVIDRKTWVKGTSATSYGSYTLGQGSFLNGQGKSQLSAKNYDLVYVANAGSDPVNTATNLGEYTVKPVSLTYDIVGSHTYGGTVAESYTAEARAGHLKNGDTMDDIVTKNTLDNLAKTAINGTGIDERTHVKRTAAGGVTTVYDAAVGSGWGGAVFSETPNYILQAGNLKYTVKPAEVTYTIADNAKTYGDTALRQADGGTYSGFRFGETELTAHDDAGTKANATAVTYTHMANVGGVSTDVAAAAQADAGTYAGAISGTGLYFNDYTVRYQKGAITVEKKAIAYTVGDSSRIYGNANPAFTGSFAAGSFVGTDAADLTKVSYTTAAGTTSSVGNYAVGANGTNWGEVLGARARNYIVTATPGTLNVTPRTVTYAVGNATRVYGDANPAFTGSFANMVNGDAVNAAKIRYATTATQETSVGSYEVDAAPVGGNWGTVLGANYTVSAVHKGSLTITPRDLWYKADDKSRATDQPTPPLTGRFWHDTEATKTGIMPWDMAHVATIPSASFATTTNSTSAVGVYPGDIRLTSDALASGALPSAIAGNYHFVGTLPGTMTITVPAPPPSAPSSALFDPRYEAARQPKIATGHLLPVVTNADRDGNDLGMTRSFNDPTADRETEERLRRQYIRDNGGYIPREFRGALRFLTIEDTGINLNLAALDNNAVTVESQSRADGGATIIVLGDGTGIRVTGTVPSLRGGFAPVRSEAGEENLEDDVPAL